MYLKSKLCKERVWKFCVFRYGLHFSALVMSCDLSRSRPTDWPIPRGGESLNGITNSHNCELEQATRINLVKSE